MPLTNCSLPSGGSGWKYGQSGKCYENKKDAVKQGLAENGGKWKSDASLLDQDTQNLVHSCERADHMDAIYGKARIRFAEDPATHELSWHILGTSFYFKSFSDALKFKELTDNGMNYRKAAAEVFTLPNPDATPEAGYEERLKEQERKVNPAVENSKISQPSLK